MARATSPVVGVATLLGVTVLVSLTVAGAAFATTEGLPDRTEPIVMDVGVDADRDRFVFDYRVGPPLDVDRLDIVVTVDGEPLAHQPPVPFFAATGFRSGPTGPLNRGDDGQWRAGEAASLRLASTNAPAIGRGDAVRIRLLREESLLVDRTVTAR